MKIQKKSFSMHDLLRIKARVNMKEWKPLAEELRDAAVDNGLYPTGPLFYTMKPVEGDELQRDFAIYLPVNSEVKLLEGNRVEYLPELQFKQGLSMRHADVNESLVTTEQLLEICAEKNNLSLMKPFLYIWLDVYGDPVIDVFAPIEEEQ